MNLQRQSCIKKGSPRRSGRPSARPPPPPPVAAAGRSVDVAKRRRRRVASPTSRSVAAVAKRRHCCAAQHRRHREASFCHSICCNARRGSSRSVADIAKRSPFALLSAYRCNVRRGSSLRHRLPPTALRLPPAAPPRPLPPASPPCFARQPHAPCPFFLRAAICAHARKNAAWTHFPDRPLSKDT